MDNQDEIKEQMKKEKAAQKKSRESKDVIPDMAFEESKDHVKINKEKYIGVKLPDTNLDIISECVDDDTSRFQTNDLD